MSSEQRHQTHLSTWRSRTDSGLAVPDEPPLPVPPTLICAPSLPWAPSLAQLEAARCYRLRYLGVEWTGTHGDSRKITALGEIFRRPESRGSWRKTAGDDHDLKLTRGDTSRRLFYVITKIPCVYLVMGIFRSLNRYFWLWTQQKVTSSLLEPLGPPTRTGFLTIHRPQPTETKGDIQP